MFSVSHEIINGFNCITIMDTVSGSKVSVVPECGAILHAFQVFKNHDYFNVIDSYPSIEDFKKKTEKLGFKGCKLSPFVCRLKDGKYHFAENNYKIEKFYLGNHAIHGLLYNRKFDLTNEEIREDAASITLTCNYRKEDNGYPFNYDCMIIYKLETKNKLTVTTLISNQDKGLIPVQDGWHPYFQLHDKINELQLEFQAKQMMSFDDELIPDGNMIPYQVFGSLKKIEETNLDNCFLLNFAECQPMCVLRNIKENIQLEIRPEASYPYLQIYIPEHRNSIALENLSSPPDAFNNGIDLKILAPGQTATFTTSYMITLLS